MTKHPLEGLSPRDAIELRCGLCQKIVMVAGTRVELLRTLPSHLRRHHGHDGDVLLEGEHFTIEKAPLARCDLCGTAAEPPWWVWITPPGPDYAVEDPAWCVCDGCHPLVESRDLAELRRRCWQVNQAEFAVDDVQQRKLSIHTVMSKFLDHVDPSQTFRENAY